MVARRALELDLPGPVVVASDDERVLEAVAPLGVRGVLTRSDHRCGTERVAEVVSSPGYREAEVVVNLQGDEPFIPADAVHGAVERVRAGDDVGTAAQPLDGHGPSASVVRVAVDDAGQAVSFFRDAVPPRGRSARHAVLEHIGVYAYTPRRLLAWLALPPTPDERDQGLEQLRPLHHGWRIGVATLAAREAHSIDTETDLRLAEAML